MLFLALSSIFCLIKTHEYKKVSVWVESKVSSLAPTFPISDEYINAVSTSSFIGYKKIKSLYKAEEIKKSNKRKRKHPQCLCIYLKILGYSIRHLMKCSMFSLLLIIQVIIFENSYMGKSQNTSMTGGINKNRQANLLIIKDPKEWCTGED